MKVGFIGTGSMGTILIEAFIQSGALTQKQIMISNRTRGKAAILAERYPGLTMAYSNCEIAKKQQVIFICVKPHEYISVIEDIEPYVSAETIIVSITSPVLIKHLEDRLPCKIAKIIPSITNYALSGASLCMYSERMQPADREMLESLFRKISTPHRIDEAYTRITSDLSSCGPAFLCYFLEQFVAAAVEVTGISMDEANRLASDMMLGTAKLLVEKEFTPASLQERVSVPGGITAEGLNLMENCLDGMFKQLILTTHAKYNSDLMKVESLFYGQKA